MSTTTNILDILALIRKAPRTVPELAEITGRTETGIWRTVNAAHAEGHVYIAGERPHRSAKRAPRVFAWNPSPFEIPDWQKATATGL